MIVSSISTKPYTFNQNRPVLDPMELWSLQWQYPEVGRHLGIPRCYASVYHLMFGTLRFVLGANEVTA